MKKRISLIGLILVLITSCKNESTNSYMVEYFERENYNPEIIKEQKVVERIKTEMNTGSNNTIVVLSDGNQISPNKIKTIEYFNENGLCTLKINPTYKKIENPNNNLNNLSPSERFFYQKEIEGNEPSGFNDSTYNSFDEKHRLVEEKEVKRDEYGQITSVITTTFSYDDRDNLIQTCSELNNTQSVCRYSIYNYGSNGNIKSSKDSFSVQFKGGRPYPNEDYIYTYDSNNRIKSINDRHFVYDKNNLLIEEYELSDNKKISIINKKFDKNGNNITIERIKPELSTYDPRTNIRSVQSYDTSITYNRFSNKNLLIETSHKPSNKSVDYVLFKYDYKFR